jgi:hypothetical protein
MPTNWFVLTATLPTSPSGLRVRVWRALKATGAGTLREGVYVLPDHAPSAQKLWELERTISEAGADAHMLVLQARDDTQEQSFRALFDRSDLYAELEQSIKEARKRICTSTEAQLHRTLRDLDAQLQAIRASDFFAGTNDQEATDALTNLRREVTLHLSPDEPEATEASIPKRTIADYQGRTWATRKRPWVDRLATAWLVHRFIDKKPTFTWIADPKRCPKSALGYDFDGATFTHVGDKVTFEVVAESFGLLETPGLRRLSALVRCIDIGGVPVEEAPGFEMLIRGLQALHAVDDDLLGAALPVFDATHAAMRVNK